MRAAVNFTCANPTGAEAQTVVVYTWNESSENGAALIPSLGNGTLYVDALAKVLPMTCPAPRGEPLRNSHSLRPRSQQTTSL